MLLTAAVGAGNSTIMKGYEIDQLALYLDFINLMTYDFHGGSWENVTGLHTGLYARPEETDILATWNQVHSLGNCFAYQCFYCIRIGLFDIGLVKECHERKYAWVWRLTDEHSN